VRREAIGNILVKDNPTAKVKRMDMLGG